MIFAFIRKYAAIIGFLGLWEGLSRLRVIDPLFFPPFTQVVAEIVHLLRIGVLGPQIKASLQRAIPGFLLATLMGVPLGLLLGSWFKTLTNYLELPLEIFSQLNPFLLFHIIILFMGIGEAPKVTIVAWTCLWPIVFSSMSGAAQVNPSLLKSGRAFGLSRLGLLRKITWPAASPVVFAGIRLSLGYSLFMLIAAEMMGASSGLGFMVQRTQETFQLDRLYAAVTVIAFLGLILDASLQLLGRAFLYTKLENYVNTPGD
ncbi:MAG: ABC transporter permease [Deltaproteobacteria bacterium]|jgi:NitT/TauT family transport system permease protein|nr:ABC transporter permease [Deltaproteobacteria bacterium]